MDSYLLKTTCSACSKAVGIGWAFCGYCGNVIDNDGSRVTLSLSLEQLLKEKEFSNSPKVLNRFVDKLKTTISNPLDKGDEVKVANLSPFLFIVANNEVRTKKIDDVRLDNEQGAIKKDNKGYYYVNDYQSAVVNAKVLQQGKRHYFVNGDSLKINDEIYIFSVMNQDLVGWQTVDLTDDVAKELLVDNIEMTESGLIFVTPEPAGQITLNKSPISERTRLKPYDLFSCDHRLFLLLEDRLICQEPLQDDQQKSIMENIYAQELGGRLEVAIKERRAGSKVLLSDINFSVLPGEMVLILGGSGAGKTTLINAIMGSEKADATILLGNKNIYDEFEQVKRMIANVPQFSLHREKDTVYMTVKDAAEMKLVRDFVKDRVLLEEKINSVLETVNLSKKRDSLVSSLSGGEKKRLSIATEYISDPLVFILDEPDSGVDGSNARAIMSSLRNIANQGKIILVISHNPDRTPEDFDKVLVLAKSEQESCGKLAFYGSVDETLTFFETDQLELVVSEIEEKPDYYINKYQEFLTKA